MAIPASGEISWSQLRAEFGGGSGELALSSLYRGGSRIRANAANNPSTNLAASVPAGGEIALSNFRGAARGFHFYINWNVANYWMNNLFGSDWGVDYPKTAEISPSAVMYATDTGNFGFCAPSGAAGEVTLINRGHIFGAGGQSSGAGGQIALRLDCPNLHLYNYGVIGSGGGAGGVGGHGGTGGQGFYDTGYTVREPASGWSYAANSYDWATLGKQIYWGGGLVGTYPTGVSSHTIGGITYYQGPQGAGTHYQIARTYPSSYRTYTSGGGGGAGGAGGRGISYGSANLGGAGGSPGAGGGANAGSGGYGGTGGTGGWWGGAGGSGHPGATGNSGNYTGGSASGGGGAGGPAGYAIYHTTYGYSRHVTGTIYGPITG
jgi:hypothetical protein